MLRNKQSIFSVIVLVLALGILGARAFTGPSQAPATENGIISVSGSTVSIDGGSGKLTAGTIDPLYTIDGGKYATFVTGMIGLKEETAGVAYVPGELTIDFRNQRVGTELWLFAKVTDLERNFDKMVVNLTPSFDGAVWYEKDLENLRLTFHTHESGEVSYRLIAPRFDWNDWPMDVSNTEDLDGLIISTGPDGKMIWGVN